jgi:hypothetical protein
MLVDNTTTGLGSIDSMFFFFLLMIILHHSHDISHPGYFGKIGRRVFHLKKDYYYRPKIAVDKLWSLLPADTYQQFKDKKDGTAPVVDVTQSVCILPPLPLLHPLTLPHFLHTTIS